ncbi:hypothetical protein C9J12_05115 [Photobacterium frigidiphilum]|uniref:Uncharacterized protein n=1 Tax=Photobacterium frigidiphilum TaxID=264736 RepID=A0A2T3JM61_9GAMM|nr:hypothetical protein [Photobacterium frigidiphilum]PSU50124.1 hypothetical protein C9J12_05115 [Photobacterium frigidiphilum]
MRSSNSIDESASAIRKLWEKHGIKKPMRLLGFCLSMLPIPVIQQAGLALDRHLSDKDLDRELTEIWEKIAEVNEKVNSVDTLEESIAEIAKTVAENEALQKECEKLSYILGAKESIFSVETDDHSYQELVRTVIEASRVRISATNASANVIEDTNVHSANTHLHASGGSSNFVDRTNFTDGSRTVGMQGISTQGDIHVSGNSVGFGNGGALLFGGNPNLISGRCPSCQNKIELDKRSLAGYSSIQCPHCKNVFPFNIG